MNKFYYFSKSKLKFVEIKNFTKKFYGLITVISILISSLLFGGYFLVKSFSNSDNEISKLRNTNKKLTKKFSELFTLYSQLNNKIDSLSDVNSDLRVSANLAPISDEERNLGVGGGLFDELSNNIMEIDLDELSDFVDGVKNKIEFEKSNYAEITTKLKSNEKLYASLPALKPSEGTFGLHGFGMRLHPILRIRRMHEGIDIITNVGTPVQCPGNGVVEFIGKRGGYGLCIEINHGFGYRTIYGHLSSINVKKGQKITRGQVIAKTGNSGLSTGPHLHYEVHHNGVKLDPIDFVFDDLNIFEPTVKK